MTTAVLLGFIGGLAALVLRAILGWIVGGELKGAFADRMKSRVHDAAQKLPPDVAADQEDEWLRELEELKDRPLRALRFTRGLNAAALSIAEAALGEVASESRRADGNLLRAIRTTARVVTQWRLPLRRIALAPPIALLLLAEPRLIAAAFTAAGILYAGRVYVHFVSGYASSSSGMATRSLKRLMTVDVLMVIAWLATGLVAMLMQNPLFLVVAAIALIPAVLIVAALTLGAAEAAGLPRGTEAAAGSAVMHWIRRYGRASESFPGVPALLRLLDHGTPVNQVSPLVGALGLFLFVIVLRHTARALAATHPLESLTQPPVLEPS